MDRDAMTSKKPEKTTGEKMKDALLGVFALATIAIIAVAVVVVSVLAVRWAFTVPL